MIFLQEINTEPLYCKYTFVQKENLQSLKITCKKNQIKFVTPCQLPVCCLEGDWQGVTGKI